MFFNPMNILNTFEAPGLFAPEEIEPHVVTLREAMNQDTSYNGPRKVYNYFTYQIQKYLRLVLVMDSEDSQFTMRIQSNPAILNACDIIWKTNYIPTTFVRIAQQLVGSEIIKQLPNAKGLLKAFIKSHRQFSGVTPLHFTNFVTLFNDIYTSNRDKINGQQDRLNAGLTKLAEAEETVKVLSAEATEKRKVLAKKRVENEENMKSIEQNMDKAVKQKSVVKKIQNKIDAENEKLAVQQEQIDKQFAKVKPLIKSAEAAVKKLSSRHLNSIRQFPNPPPAVKHVLEAVLRYMGNTEVSWKAMQRFLGTKGVVQQILNFDASSVSNQVMKTVVQCMNENPDSFKESVISRVSKDALPLAKWVVANVEYAKIATKVKPLTDKQNALKSKSRELLAHQQRYQKALDALNAKTKKLQENFAKSNQEAAVLQVGLDEVENTLNSAMSLLGKLGDEKTRWGKSTQEAASILKELPNRALLAAAFIVYLGGMSENMRMEHVEGIRDLLGISSFDIRNFMRTESELLKYKQQNLPSDNLSQENAVIILDALQYPLIIDPAQQASQWLENYWKENSNDQGEKRKVVVTNTQHPTFSNSLELAIRFGHILIIQDVDKIEPVLMPIIRRELAVHGQRKTLQLNKDKIIDFNENFRMYLVTRISNLELPPNISPLLTTVNFSVTRSGLEGQLLGITIKNENPQLEQQKSALLQKEETYKIELAELENKLLDELAKSKGNLLENVELIEQLNEIKQRSQEIFTSLQESAKVKEEIENNRNGYRSFAKAGSTMFFLVRELNSINPMYQFSLSGFLRLFSRALGQGDKKSTLEVRIALLTNELQKIVYNYYSQALFKRDVLIFGVYMVQQLYSTSIPQEQWDYFIGRVNVSQSVGYVDISPPTWMNPTRSEAFKDMVKTLPEFAQGLDLNNDHIWSQWIRSKDCTVAPYSVSKKLKPFEKLIMMKVFRPDQVYSSMEQYVIQSLNLKNAHSNTFDIEHTFKHESSPSEPILLITTPGADPTQELEEVAKRIVGSSNFNQIAMGQGQTDIALDMLEKCAKEGEWLCLMNLHLVVSWLPILEKKLSLISNPHENFRLWLTTEVHDHFPEILLQQSLKITFESPPGIKQNLLRIYKNWDDAYLKKGNISRAQLLFMTSWFHAVVQERRSYIPQGFTKFYEFSSADLRAAVDIIEEMMDSSQQIDFDRIYGLFEQAIYGGRIDNIYDIRVLRTYLHRFFSRSLIGSSQSLSMKSELLKGFPMPSTNSIHEYSGFIEKLPNQDPLEAFQLPANSNRVVQTHRADYVTKQLKYVANASSSGIVENTSASAGGHWMDKIQPVINYWNSIVEVNRGVLFLQSKLPESNLVLPVQAFIHLEYQQGLELCKLIEQSINDIQDVRSGNSLETPLIKENVQALLEDSVPNAWAKLWDIGPEQSQLFLKQVVEKTVAIAQMYNSEGFLNEMAINLKYFFNPDVFLNAFKQQSARTRNVPVDNLKYLATIWEGQPSAASLKDQMGLSIQIEGLLLQGAGFNGASLSELSSDAPPVSVMPRCYLSWMPEKDIEKFTKNELHQSSVSLPIYLTSQRENNIAQFT
eukprot:CAMPEP_0117419094 /NCGR_PEP_ID=MMETSP0758-20121206/738_1 /TAXON_ID=63605 /ORGANISM="Percolomonas cosmopolitus, Strain AE-1 (ATCC 50343)" /LENGTH=1572 /DNA_ID=CAMNT_0005199979 /DNA_START=400 /DNA_END=5115 /DNA_ORIENTATION=-